MRTHAHSHTCTCTQMEEKQQPSSSTDVGIPRITALLNLSDFTASVKSSVPITTPLFHATPSTVSFHEYTPFTTYTQIITLRNRDSVARRVMVEPPTSHHFWVQLTSAVTTTTTSQMEKPTTMLSRDASSKVAPGMSLSYTLFFRPQSRQDYACDLTVTTEREKFILPVRCQGKIYTHSRTRERTSMVHDLEDRLKGKKTKEGR